MKRTRVLKRHGSPILGWLLSVIFLILSPLAYGQDTEPNNSDDSGPKVTRSIGSTGFFEIYPDLVQGYVRQRDTILRASDAPDCVAHLRSNTSPLSPGGDVTVGGDNVGQVNGPPAPIVVSPDQNNQYVYFLDNPPVLYPAGSSLRVQVKTSGAVGVPAMPLTTLRSPSFSTIHVSKPVVPPGADIPIPSTAPFEILWTIPGANAGAQNRKNRKNRMILSLMFIIGNERMGELHCGAPVNAGRATLPASLLRALKQRIAPNPGASLRIRAGDQREVVVDGASYVLQLAAGNETDFNEVGATLQ